MTGEGDDPPDDHSEPPPELLAPTPVAAPMAPGATAGVLAQAQTQVGVGFSFAPGVYETLAQHHGERMMTALESGILVNKDLALKRFDLDKEEQQAEAALASQRLIAEGDRHQETLRFFAWAGLALAVFLAFCLVSILVYAANTGDSDLPNRMVDLGLAIFASSGVTGGVGAAAWAKSQTSPPSP